METLKINDRVIAKANTQFKGTVIEAADDGTSGYVRFDAEDDGRTFFHASELEPETRAEPAPKEPEVTYVQPQKAKPEPAHVEQPQKAKAPKR